MFGTVYPHARKPCHVAFDGQAKRNDWINHVSRHSMALEFVFVHCTYPEQESTIESTSDQYYQKLVQCNSNFHLPMRCKHSLSQ